MVVAGLGAIVAYANGCKVGLFKDAVIPDDWWLIGSYSQPDNAGYELIEPGFLMPDDPSPPVVHSLSSTIEWEADPSGPDDLIRGWFLYDEEREEVVLVLLYGAVEPFIRDGPFFIEADLSTFASVFE